MSKNGFLQYVLHDAMHGITGVTARPMFGAYGLYKDGTVFGIVDGEELYFKVDAKNLPRYRLRHSRPLTYEGKSRKVIALPYWEVPAEVLEDREALVEWVNASVAISRPAMKIKRGDRF